ncbi:MAG: hypothetical protein ACKOD0_07335 [Actinomycetota bacterium]
MGSKQLKSDAVIGVKVRDAAITAQKLAAASVTSPKIARNAVTSAKIADGSIVADDIAAATQASLRGTATTAASGIFVPRSGTTKVLGSGWVEKIMVSLGREYRTDVDAPSPGGPNYIQTTQASRLFITATANLMRTTGNGASAAAKVVCSLQWHNVRQEAWYNIPGAVRQTFAIGSNPTYESVTVIGWVDVPGTVNGQATITDVHLICEPEVSAGFDAPVQLQSAAINVIGVAGAGTGLTGTGTGSDGVIAK